MTSRPHARVPAESTLRPSDPAPTFRLRGADGSAVALSDFRDTTVIVYFYPAAGTPACTVEAVEFSARSAAWERAGYTIIGISPDTVDTLAKFVRDNDLHITVLSDPDRCVIQAWGAWGDRMIWGKTVTGVLRSTFVVATDHDGNGTILDAQYGVRARGHVERLERQLGIL
ncbi:MAG: peroxiredoxin [Propionibacteriaceae bacterium]|nr:peroxiredoxin [Propionibacteriaceae bacterium]